MPYGIVKPCDACMRRHMCPQPPGRLACLTCARTPGAAKGPGKLGQDDQAQQQVQGACCARRQAHSPGRALGAAGAPAAPRCCPACWPAAAHTELQVRWIHSLRKRAARGSCCREVTSGRQLLYRWGVVAQGVHDTKLSPGRVILYNSSSPFPCPQSPALPDWGPPLRGAGKGFSRRA